LLRFATIELDFVSCHNYGRYAVFSILYSLSSLPLRDPQQIWGVMSNQLFALKYVQPLMQGRIQEGVGGAESAGPPLEGCNGPKGQNRIEQYSERQQITILPHKITSAKSFLWAISALPPHGEILGTCLPLCNTREPRRDLFCRIVRS